MLGQDVAQTIRSKPVTAMSASAVYTRASLGQVLPPKADGLVRRNMVLNFTPSTGRATEVALSGAAEREVPKSLFILAAAFMPSAGAHRN
jgi:hypothetical protein